MTFEMCDCGNKPIHGYIILDGEKGKETIPFPISSKAMGFLFLDIFRFNDVIPGNEAGVVEGEIRDSTLPDDLTKGDLYWLAHGIHHMVVEYNFEKVSAHRREIAACN